MIEWGVNLFGNNFIQNVRSGTLYNCATVFSQTKILDEMHATYLMCVYLVSGFVYVMYTRWVAPRFIIHNYMCTITHSTATPYTHTAVHCARRSRRRRRRTNSTTLLLLTRLLCHLLCVIVARLSPFPFSHIALVPSRCSFVFILDINYIQ